MIKEQIQECIQRILDAVSRGLIQESTANYLQKEVFAIKKAILQPFYVYMRF